MNEDNHEEEKKDIINFISKVLVAAALIFWGLNQRGGCKLEKSKTGEEMRKEQLLRNKLRRAQDSVNNPEIYIRRPKPLD